MGRINKLRAFRKAFRNWISVLYKLKFKKESMVRTRLRNKEEYVVLPKELVYFASELIRVYKSLKMFEYDFQSNILIFSYANRITKMKFYKNGHFNGEFSSFLGEYDFLEPIKGNTVIDVGANIADSSISFALSGASKVIAVEPYRWSYGMATENIELNNLKDCIVMLNAGYGMDGEIEIEDTITNVGTVLKEVKGGVRIPILSLRTLISQYDYYIRGNLLLKMDCEGCEYNIVNEEDSTLHKFRKILIEYHRGYENLVGKLKKCGFTVKYTEPHVWYHQNTNRNLVHGYLYAYRE